MAALGAKKTRLQPAGKGRKVERRSVSLNVLDIINVCRLLTACKPRPTAT